MEKCADKFMRKRIFLNVTIIYIDEKGVYGSNSGMIKTACEKYKVHYIIVPLGYIYEIAEFLLPAKLSNSQVTVVKRLSKTERKLKATEEVKIPVFEAPESQILNCSEESKERLSKFLGSFKIENKHEVVTYIKKWLILYFAKKYKFTKVFLAHNANAVAAHLFNFAISGRGQNMSSEADYADGKYEGTMFGRVIKDCLDKEVYYYAHLNNIKGIQKRYEDEFINQYMPGKGSKEALIKEFLNRLQVVLIKIIGSFRIYDDYSNANDS